jgi:putative endopeptidase
MKKRLLLLLVPAAAFLMAAAPASTPVDAEHYLDQFIDQSVNPADDFFHYSVGKWLKANPIPASERGWGIGNIVQEETYQRLLTISNEAAAAHAATGTSAQKIGDFWAAGIDTDAIAKTGMAPLADEFATIAKITDKPSLLAAVSHLQYLGVDALCSVGISQDEKNSDRIALHLYQGGLGLPNRDYYFDTDKRGLMLRTEYVKHVAKMFTLLGDSPLKAKANAATVMAIETELAKASRKLEALRDPIKNYNAMSVAGVQKLTPTIKWKTFFEAQGIRGIDSVIVGQPEFYRQLEKSLTLRTIPAWKTYLRYHLASTFASDAGGAFEQEEFHYFGTIMNGTKVQRPRWKRMLDYEEGYLGDALGQLYVSRYFSPATKARYEQLTNNVFDAFRERIKNLDWMSEATKKQALVKLNAVTKKVGYPAKWRDYTNFAVTRESFLQDIINGNKWKSDYYINKLGKPVDRTEWDMTPQTYNAYYNPSNNEIVLPAAIFILPGIADSLVDDAVVYGYGAGTTIGHEITHGFDDEGRQFDEKGNLKEWWTPADNKEFNLRAAGIIRQFNQYIAVNDLHVNGAATAGENIADLGGMVLGWEAFKKTDQYKQNKTLGGLTPAQRYYVGWALGWMGEIRPENIAMRVKTDVHSPSFLRVTGPMTNQTTFYEAFGVKPGDKMYRPDSVRVKIW